MTDLISRKAAIKALCENGMCETKNCNAFPCEDVKAIERVPTIDPVKHGKWIGTWEKGTYTCSECRFIMDTPNDVTTNYCPNCGSQMESGE